MLRTSLYFLLIALLALLFADVSITPLDPLVELRKISIGFVTPDFFRLSGFGKALINTVSFALIGITLAVAAGAVLALFFEYAPVRLFCAFIRAIHELFWAFIIMPITGLNSLCGILAIAIPYAGVFAKVYAEIRQEANPEAAEALPTSTSKVSGFLYTTLPVIFHELKNYTSYRFECALRSSAILGFIGLPTLGYHLETAFREGMYSSAAALLYIFYMLIISIRLWARPRIIPLLLLVACFLTSWETSLSIDNILRFFAYDILPWPMRADGFYVGEQSVTLPFWEVLSWLGEVLKQEALPGVWNTLLLTQVALVGTAFFTLVSFPFASNQFFSKKITAFSHLTLVVLRTTPEYILAYLFLLLWGPSMLPAIIALTLHNGAILSYLTARNVNLLQLPFDASQYKINRYLYEVLPRSYGQLLAFLFYRWEVIMRESAILGILGITTLGHFIDSAIARDHLDTALVLIVMTAILNMLIDSLSQLIRKKMHISAHVTVCASS